MDIAMAPARVDVAVVSPAAERGPSPWRFFALTYALSWGIWAPLVLSHFGIGPFAIPEGTIALLRLFGVLMPATAALILLRRAGCGQVAQVLGRFRIWRVGWQWWFAAAIVQPLVLVACGVAYGLLGGDPISPRSFGSVAEVAVTVIFLLIAVLGEEIGWRGLALPALQARMSPLRASFVLGALWGVWHVPFWLLLSTYTQFGVAYLVLNLLFIAPCTAYITWFFNHTGGSLLVVAAFHMVFNIVNTAWLPVTTVIAPFVAFVAIDWVITLAVARHLGRPPEESRPPARGGPRLTPLERESE